MAYVPNFTEAKQALLEPKAESNQGPVQLSSSGGGGDSGGVFQASATPQSVNAPTPTQSQSQPLARLSSQATSNAVGNVFQPLQQKQQETGQQLGGTVQKFYQEAGPQRTYEGIGAQGTLQGAIGGSNEDLVAQQKRMEEAKNLVNTQYKGPTELNQEDMNKVGTGLQESQGTAQALQSSGGKYSLLQKMASGLTPGQLKYETQLMGQDPEFKKQSQAYQKESANLATQVASEQQKAQEFATQRGTQESDISKKSREYLTGQKTNVEQQLQDTIKQRNDQEAATRAAYEQFMKTGTQEDWAKIGNYGTYQPTQPEGQYVAPKQLDAGSFNTPITQNVNKAQTQYDAVMGKYADVKDIPTAQLKGTKEGFEHYVFTTKDGKKIETKTDTRPTDAQAAMLWDRQKELEKSGFSPGSQYEKKMANKAAKEAGTGEKKLVGGQMVQMTKDEKAAPVAGELAPYMPLYYAEGGPEGAKYTPPDFQNYTVWHPGVSPSRQNVSTETQRNIYNNVSELMDQADQLEAAGEPWKAAAVGADIQKFIDDEQRGIDARKGILDESSRKWTKQIQKMRDAYRKSQSGWAKVARTMTGVAGDMGVPAPVTDMAMKMASMGMSMASPFVSMGTGMMPNGGVAQQNWDAAQYALNQKDVKDKDAGLNALKSVY